ncbi:uncharacterized protein BDCG_16532 [Blastomyces dermatitidis ER-3]|uniref:Uncharacterized protein n=2 Tax=Ajellomyces dermatitidis TaxID=5039 RepID=F2TPS0_AJEDA|nr:uncharacterized protein BDCG_16532 [Blastomyces dermatitidis ER-3]EGE85233.2 hypothetical protein BDDG_08178 [Blastomyces dermatitidis ATCC 18188]EQL31959.1 hypothetical protein BDFG_05756 [Blastomyces dermatitidis ATCC 26199]OAT00230.1 hypothetical protein BDCG_16532 [Blastomyces dermatitidis ER-3]
MAYRAWARAYCVCRQRIVAFTQPDVSSHEFIILDQEPYQPSLFVSSGCTGRYQTGGLTHGHAWDKENFEGVPLLYLAASSGSIPICMHLLSMGADVNFQCSYSPTGINLRSMIIRKSRSN